MQLGGIVFGCSLDTILASEHKGSYLITRLSITSLNVLGPVGSTSTKPHSTHLLQIGNILSDQFVEKVGLAFMMNVASKSWESFLDALDLHFRQ